MPDGEDPEQIGRTRKIGEDRCRSTSTDEKCGQQYESYKRLTEEKKDETCPACGRPRGEVGDLPVHREGDLARGGLRGVGPRRSPFG